MTQLSGGADLEPMGMAQDVPHEPPPEYSPRQSGHPRVVVDPPAELDHEGDTSYPREKMPIARQDETDSQQVRNQAVDQPLATPLEEIPGTLSRASPLATSRQAVSDPPSNAFVGLGINGDVPSIPVPDALVATSPSSSRHLPQPLSDKEQMKRYYAAQDRIAQSQAMPPAFYQAQDDPGRPSQAESSGSSMKPLSDKEAMRRFYEAQDRMSQAQAGSSSRMPDQAEGSSSASHAGSSKPAPFDPSPRFMSASEEKDTMKRRYEQATRQVSNHHQSKRSDSGWSESGHGHGSSNSATPTRAEFGAAEISGSGSSQGHSRWASATEEKDIMRRRYEEAVNAMGQSSLAEGSGSATRAGSSSQHEQSYASASDNLHAPPPIPARPNDEYKTLLSPDLSPGMPGMPGGSPYMYGGPMMGPPFGMPMIPPFGAPMSPTMGSMFGMPAMGMAPMPLNNSYAYGMPGPMPQGYHAQPPFSGQYQMQPMDEQREGNDGPYRHNHS